MLERILYLQTLYLRRELRLFLRLKSLYCPIIVSLLVKRYSYDNMFILNIVCNNNNNNKSGVSNYMIDSSTLWHNHLGHVNFKYLKFMSKQCLISSIDNNSKTCEICIRSQDD